MDEVKRDVDNAKLIDEALRDSDLLGNSSPSGHYENINGLLMAVKDANPGRDEELSSSGTNQWDIEADEYEDERLAWFSTWIRDRPTIEDSFYHVLTWRNNGGQSCFLGDANSLLLSADFFSEAVDYIRSRFPILSRFTVYGRTKSAAKKTSTI